MDTPCACRIIWRMLPGEGEMGYRAVSDPGCPDCEQEPCPLAMIVDRYLIPVHRRHVLIVNNGRLSEECWAEATPAENQVTFDWANNGCEDDESHRGMSFQTVKRPAVKVGERWLRRLPNVVVM